MDALSIAAQSQNETLMRRYLQTRYEFIGKDFDRINGYNTVIITLAYGGFFAIWNFVSASLHPWDQALIAALLGGSILLFVFWTVAQAFALSADTMRKISQINKAASLEDRIVGLSRLDESGRSPRLYTLWWLVFPAAALTGLGSGVLLLIKLIAVVLGLDFSYYAVFDYL